MAALVRNEGREMSIGTNLKSGVIILVFVVGMVSIASGRTIYVDDDGPADFNTIQAAIDDSNDGETVIVQPGLYDETIHFLGKNITVTGTNPTNPNVVAETTIDGSVVFSGTEDPNCILAGFNINSVIYGGSYENHTHATISYCVLQANVVPYGNVIAFCDGTIKNCLIADNIPDDNPLTMIDPAIYQCHGLFKNCTIVNNFCAVAIEVETGCSVIIENCIIYGNLEYDQIFVDCPAMINITYSNIEGGSNGIVLFGIDCTLNWGPGNIDTDPCFVRLGYRDFNEPRTSFEGDYHLQSEAGRWDANLNDWVTDANTSPCIDAGDPVSPVGFEPFPNGGRINMGAYGGTAEASKSYFGKPVCEIIVAGDVNGDCIVNYLDFRLMALHWLRDENK